jgi:phosphate transport system permease protein
MFSDAPARAGPARPTLRLARFHGLGEAIVEAAIRLCGWSGILLVFAILLFVVREAAPALSTLDLTEFVTSVEWRPDSPIRQRYGILALLVGTVAVTALAIALAVPAGFGAAIFISEFCGARTRELLKIVIEFLAAIPSVVWGFIGYMVLNPVIIWMTDAPVGINVLNGGIILALMSVPIVTSVAEDALKAVPDSYREAALALGVSRWQLTWRVLLPAAKNGLLAAALLGVGRAVGETMAVLMATGHSVRIPEGMLDPVRTLTATIAAELGEAVEGGTHYRVLFAIGSVLMLLSLLINAAADLAVRGIRRKADAP